MLNLRDVLKPDHAVNRRDPTDRRTRPTPFVSRYWLFGRRRGGRRDTEATDIYVDRYSASELFLVLGVLVLSVLDMVFTLVHLDAGGTEANPVMAWVLEWGGQGGFRWVKLLATLLGLGVLLIHVRFKRVKKLLSFAFLLYFGIFVFHMYLVYLRNAPTM